MPIETVELIEGKVKITTEPCENRVVVYDRNITLRNGRRSAISNYAKAPKSNHSWLLIKFI